MLKMDVDPPTTLRRALQVKPKTLMGPGPTNPYTRVTNALSLPLLGHFHQATFKIMDEIKEGIQYLFQTRNELTLALSASGHGGMEAALCNLTEPGDKVLVLVNGIWGQRAADMARRYGGSVETIEASLGSNFSIHEIERAIIQHNPCLIFVTQGESSTGVYQPIEDIGAVCHKHGCLLIVDTVASIGGVPFFADKWEVDCVYTGSQKTLGAPPGLAPISFSPLAVNKIKSRKIPPSVFYWDMKPLGQYWNCYPGLPRVYHHTISTPLLYALREALAMLAEESLENCIRRHQNSAKRLHEELERLDFQLYVKNTEARLPTVTTVQIPVHIDAAKLVSVSLNELGVEIAGGLGPTVGKVLRIGLMGRNATKENVDLCINTIRVAVNKSRL